MTARCVVGRCPGLQDKLYWRRVDSVFVTGIFHCFSKAKQPRWLPRRWVSLCGRETITSTGGQAIQRPTPVLRCGQCDGLEADRRGWDGSGTTTMDQVR